MNFLQRMRGQAADIAKATKLEEELDRLDALLKRQERAVRDAFAEFLKDARSPGTIREISGLLQAGDVEGALRVMDTYATRMGSVIPGIFQRAAAAEIAALTPLLLQINPRVAIAFDPTDRAAADLMRRATLEFIVGFNEKQREATRAALIASMLKGSGAAETARAFRESIGLTTHQMATVERYRELLEARSSQALDLKTRDARYDGTVRRAIRDREPIPAAKIDIMVERFRERMLRQRSETIAITEATRATAEARDEAFRQAAEASGLDLGLVDDIWNSTRDRRTRETHREMNRQVRPFGVPFDSPSGAQLRYPGDPLAPAAEVIRCRCHKTRRIRQEGQPFGTPLEEVTL